MPVEIVVPQLGESVVEATVGRWMKQPGESVAAGEPLVALETDKVDLDVPAQQAGVLTEIRHAAGDTVNVGEVLGVLSDSGASAAVAPAAPAAEAAPTPVAAPAAPVTEKAAPVDPAGETAATPLARSIAEKNDLDISRVAGSGPGGRVTREDVTAYMEQKAPPAAAPAPAPAAVPPPGVPAAARPADTRPTAALSEDRPEERRKMSRRRQTIAARLVEAQHTAAMLTTFNEVDMTAIMDLRKRRKDAFKEKNGVGLGFMSFFTKAVIGALKAFPLLNSEIQGDEIVIKNYYDIGVAVSTDEGLVVPVVRAADRLTFAAIEQNVADLAGRARSGQLTLQELQGGTFTITNGGVFGSLLSTPILNTPQVGILGMHKIEERPIAVKGEVVIRPMMYLALSYDHRVVDGAEAVRFLVRVKELLEDPEALLLEG
jgi:2-oxoglutarate dehydrogenase E2 component (dihydrolipoamide succinyltransferase)